MAEDSLKIITVSSADHHDALVSGLWNFFTSGYRTDLAFQGKETTIRAHQLILEIFLSSEKLEALNENCLRKSGKQGKSALDLLLEFLYTGKVMVGEDQTDYLLHVANRLDFKVLVNALQTVCEKGKVATKLPRQELVQPMPRVSGAIDFSKSSNTNQTDAGDYPEPLQWRPPQRNIVSRTTDNPGDDSDFYQENLVETNVKLTVCEKDEIVKKPPRKKGVQPMPSVKRKAMDVCTTLNTHRKSAGDCLELLRMQPPQRNIVNQTDSHFYPQRNVLRTVCKKDGICEKPSRRIKLLPMPSFERKAMDFATSMNTNCMDAGNCQEALQKHAPQRNVVNQIAENPDDDSDFYPENFLELVEEMGNDFVPIRKGAEIAETESSKCGDAEFTSANSLRDQPPTQIGIDQNVKIKKENTDILKCKGTEVAAASSLRDQPPTAETLMSMINGWIGGRGSTVTRRIRTSSVLMGHARQHTSSIKRPLTCPVCDKCFFSCGNVRRHVRKLHGSVDALIQKESQEPVD